MYFISKMLALSNIELAFLCLYGVNFVLLSMLSFVAKKKPYFY